MFIMLDFKKSQFKANKVKVQAVIYGQCSETFGHNFFWDILRREFYCCNSIYFFNDLRGFLLLSMHEITLAWIYFRGVENFLLFLRICSWKRTVVFLHQLQQILIVKYFPAWCIGASFETIDCKD